MPRRRNSSGFRLGWALSLPPSCVASSYFFIEVSCSCTGAHPSLSFPGTLSPCFLIVFFLSIALSGEGASSCLLLSLSFCVHNPLPGEQSLSPSMMVMMMNIQFASEPGMKTDDACTPDVPTRHSDSRFLFFERFLVTLTRKGSSPRVSFLFLLLHCTRREGVEETSCTHSCC